METPYLQKDPSFMWMEAEAVCRRVLDLQPEEDCSVELFSKTFRHTQYLVVIPSRQQRLLWRITNHRTLHDETIGEVATLKWVRHFTNIPAHDVIAFDPSSDNEIGFQWLLMPFIAGTVVDKVWDKMSMTAKEAFTKQVAEFQAQLLDASETKSRLRGIGTLTSPFENPGRFVTDYPGYDVPQGPYHSSREWVHTLLRVSMFDVCSRYLCIQDEYVDTIERQLQTAESLLNLLPTVFPAIDQPEQTAICRFGLSLDEFLVDEEGAITAVLGWDFAPAVPCHLATELPAFLAQYSMDLTEDEQTQLRKIYTERMQELRPTWDAEVASSTLKNDFISAAGLCAYEDLLSPIETWIRAIKNGENVSLDDIAYT